MSRSGLGVPSSVGGPGTPPPPPVGCPTAPTRLQPEARAPPSSQSLRPWRAFAPPPHQGLESQASPNSPSPPPCPGSGAFDPRPAHSGSSGARAPPRPGPARRLRGDAGGSPARGGRGRPRGQAVFKAEGRQGLQAGGRGPSPRGSERLGGWRQAPV